MRTKDEIMKQVGITAEYNPRGGIIPDLADVLMIEALIDIRDILQDNLFRVADLFSAFRERD